MALKELGEAFTELGYDDISILLGELREGRRTLRWLTIYLSGQTLKKIAEFQRDYDDLRSNMESAFKEGVMKPLDTFRADLKEFSVRTLFFPPCERNLDLLSVWHTQKEKKEYEKAKANYTSARAKTQKAKKPAEAQREEQTCKEAWQKTEKDVRDRVTTIMKNDQQVREDTDDRDLLLLPTGRSTQHVCSVCITTREKFEGCPRVTEEAPASAHWPTGEGT